MTNEELDKLTPEDLKDKINDMKWDEYFIHMVKLVASKSKDLSSKCGTVIVSDDNRILATGFNGMPMGVDDYNIERHKRPAKYLYTEHGERNAIYSAAFNGVSLKGSKAYITGYPCADCARALIQSGIVEVILDPNAPDLAGQQWNTHYQAAKDMMEEAGVVVRDACI